MTFYLGLLALADSPASLSEARRRFDEWVDVLLARWPPAASGAAVPALPPTPPPPEASQPAPAGVAFDRSYRATPAGVFVARPRYVILHGTRGNAASRVAEATAAASWAVRNPLSLAWHATIADGRVYVHMPPREWGWHAGSISRYALGVEFVQPRPGDDITAAQVAAFAAWWREDVLPTWPGIALSRDMLLAHSETEQGRRDGKTDVFMSSDPRLDVLKRSIMEVVVG